MNRQEKLWCLTILILIPYLIFYTTTFYSIYNEMVYTVVIPSQKEFKALDLSYKDYHLNCKIRHICEEKIRNPCHLNPWIKVIIREEDFQDYFVAHLKYWNLNYKPEEFFRRYTVYKESFSYIHPEPEKKTEQREDEGVGNEEKKVIRRCIYM
jgi:hypothetical protein